MIADRHALNVAYFAAVKVQHRHESLAAGWLTWGQSRPPESRAYAAGEAERDAAIAYAAMLEARALYREADALRAVGA